MSTYTSPYNVSPPRNRGQTASAPASSSPPPATGLGEVPAPEGETALPTGGFLGPPEYAEGEVNAGEPFSLEDARVKDEEEVAPKEYGYPDPSQEGYKLPYVGSFELPKAYFILECLPCHEAFVSIAGALVHLKATPAHEEVKEIVGLDEAVEICGCRVVDATDEDFVRRGRVVMGPPRHN